MNRDLFPKVLQHTQDPGFYAGYTLTPVKLLSGCDGNYKLRGITRVF